MSFYNPKRNTCCIPDCTANELSKIFFNVPGNFNTCPKWLPVISRKKEIVSDKALVCVRHFNKCDLLVKESGEIVAVDCQAVSDLFNLTTPNVVKLARKRKNMIYYPDYMFYIIDRDAVPVNVNSKYLDSEDFLRDFLTVQCECYNRLEGCNAGWTINFSKNFLIFFYIQERKVKSTVKIDRALRVEITLSGRLMDPLDVTRWLPPSSRITRWSQLRMILLHFGMETKTQAPSVVFKVNLGLDK